MKREIWKLNVKTCKKISLNAVWTIFAKGLKQPLPLCNRTDRVTTISVPLPLSEFCFEANVTLTLPPRNIAHYLTLAEVSICRLGRHRNFACVKTPLLKSFQKWPNMANFTTENNTYCCRIGPAFLDTLTTLYCRFFVEVGQFNQLKVRSRRPST